MNNTNITNINAILEAVGELDNSVLENVFKPKRKKPAALIVVAAAAAVSMLVGFTAAYKNTVKVNGKGLFEYRIGIHNEVTLPSIEELTEMGAANILEHAPGTYEYTMRDIDPRELIRKYNITLLGNENFSRADLGDYSTPGYDPEEYRRLWLSKTSVTVVDDYHEDGMYGSYVGFMYWLVDNRMNLPVNFRTFCVTDKYNASFAQGFTSTKPDGSDVEVVELNNNEKALISQTDYDDGDITSLATFTYDGVVYYIHARTDISGMKRIFSDLGITG